MEIDNEGFFRKVDDGLEYVEVHAFGESSRRVCTTPTHTCVYCGTDQSQKECTNCGAPHEFKPKARPTPPPGRTEVSCDDGIFFGIWFCATIALFLLITLLIV